MELVQSSHRDGSHVYQRAMPLVMLSFFLPLIIMLIGLAWLHVTPFGDKTLLISDADGLYINYLAYVGRALKGLEGITYSFEKGLGGNMLPNIGITMLDPFFLIFAGFSIRDYPIAFTLVSLFNCSLCGLTMYLLLADLYGHKRSNLIFSTSYALMGFNVVNLFQVFFFTGVHVLPLMVMGLRRLLRDKSPSLYIFSIGYAVLTSYYFGFMLCVASVLFFLLAFWLYRKDLEGKKGKLFFKYALSSLIGGLLGAIVWLPALLGIRGGRLSQTSILHFSFKENMPLLLVGAKLFTGANSTDELINGLPNIYVGILPLALVILFFLNKEINKRKKTAAGIALGFYLLSFYIVAFNMLMHGGTVTNWFNYRYSFVFSFLLLLFAAEQWQYLDKINFQDCKTCGIIMLVATILICSTKYGFISGGAVVLDFALLMAMFGTFHMYRTDTQKNQRRVFEVIILIVCSFQLTLNYYISTKVIIKNKDWAATVSAYHETVDAVAPLFTGLQKGDPGFYRMEVNGQRSGNCGNDPMLYGYNGVGHSGSYERSFIRPALNKLGVHWFDTRIFYQPGITAATDTLLGLKYILSQEDLSEEKGLFRATNHDDIDLFRNQKNYDVYYNPDSLSIAFLSGVEIENVQTEFQDVFDNLNQIWFAISGMDKPVFVEEPDIVFRSHNLTDPFTINHNEASVIVEERDKQQSTGKVSKSELNDFLDGNIGTLKNAPRDTHSIEYTWSASRNGSVYTYNASGNTEDRGASPPVLCYEGYYDEGDTVTGYLPVTSTFVTPFLVEEVAGRFRAAYADLDALHAASEAVRARPCTIEKVKDSHLRGEFTAEDGQLLMFTIPYDEGWTCFIDGKEAEIKMVLGVFMAVDIPEGTHTYEMKFFPTGMKTGIGLSAAALLTTLVYIPVDSRRRKRFSSDAPVTTNAPEYRAL